MALKIGNNAVANAFVGSSQVRRAYKGGTLVYQGFSPASEQEFIQQTAPGGPAQLLKVYGKSIVWNQQVQEFSVAETTNAGATFAIVRSTLEIVAVDGTTNINIFVNLLDEEEMGFRQVTGHKYYSPNTLPQGVYFVQNVYGGGLVPCSGVIQEGLFNSNRQRWSLRAPIGTVIPTKEYCPIIVIDLTLLYGAGNEPTSVAQFEADYPEYDPTYDPGSLQSNKTAELRAERIPVINVWDEEWEYDKYWWNVDGVVTRHAGVFDLLINKNPIPVSSDTSYYLFTEFRQGESLAGYFNIIFADENMHYLGGWSWRGADRAFTTPANATYMFFNLSVIYGNTYRHDICINLSDPAINGQYYSHWRGSLALNLSTLTGKLNGEGASVVVFPDGLRGVGTDRDAAYGSTGEVRFGKRAYQAGDESDTSVLTDGTNTIYPLATPLTYTLDTPLPTDLTCVQGDILQRVSDNNCPFVGEMRFGL